MWSCIICSVRLEVRTPPFHGGDTGSSPVRSTLFLLLIPISFNMPRTVCVVGAGSRTGRTLIPLILRETNWNVLAISGTSSPDNHPRLQWERTDVTVRKAVKEIIMRGMPESVINAAAITNVDECEADRLACRTLNVGLVDTLLSACRNTDAHFVQISTDYVFDGTTGPNDEYATPNPINYYGRMKLAAENSCRSGGVPVAIVRTSSLYGPTLGDGGYLGSVYKELTENRPYRAATDLHSTPTLVDDLALALLRINRNKLTGVYHVAGDSYLSRYEVGIMIANIFEMDSSLVIPVKAESLGLRARRPLAAGLINLKATTSLGVRFRSVADGIQVLRSRVPDIHYL